MDDLKELDDAIGKGDVAKVRRLATKENVNQILGVGETPIARAVETGNLLVLQALLEVGADLNQTCSTRNGNTPLTLACICGREEVVKFLLDAGADVNVPGISLHGTEHLPLQTAAKARTDADLRILALLIEAGADLNAGKYANPLIFAASGLPEATLALLHAGADVNLMMPLGTALMSAIEESRADIVEILLEHGADTQMKTPADHDFPGLTALEYAKKRKNAQICRLLEAASGVKVAKNKLPIEDLWATLQQQLERVSFLPGAPQSIKKLETRLGKALPESFVACYRISDGQKEGKQAFVPRRGMLDSGYFLMPVVKIIKDAKMLAELLKAGELAGRIWSDRAIRNDAWNLAWVPFATNGNGDYLCLDLDPTPKGTYGQVISFNHENHRRELLAPDFETWLVDLLEAMTLGKK